MDRESSICSQVRNCFPVGVALSNAECVDIFDQAMVKAKTLPHGQERALAQSIVAQKQAIKALK